VTRSSCYDFSRFCDQLYLWWRFRARGNIVCYFDDSLWCLRQDIFIYSQFESKCVIFVTWGSVGIILIKRLLNCSDIGHRIIGKNLGHHDNIEQLKIK